MVRLIQQNPAWMKVLTILSGIWRLRNCTSSKGQVAYPGQRFALDGDEFVDIEDLLRLRAVKIYEDSDEGWAKQRIAEIPQKPKRRRNRG
jgi:hypothetical protein